ncbi:HIT-like protein [Laetiporus sulphureus 93-53]|uniref:HIT-like protein n=1 Tax=Laetiporus sulphureus 93-53 TaxID=1314785 RepID=A0A165HNP5_9APHY|nr:HIT-like protein [Laetiporus sulphureus 93-53]KZT11978.1 HIT-like protein [Laetiporus sulphureus 93-53]
MTSFMIKAHEGLPLPQSWNTVPDCPFCRIIRGETPAFRVYEDDKIIAILDIAPLRSGHTLVIPKIHIPRVSELPPEFAAAVGAGVTRVANAIAQALQNTALNIVCNQEYAQAVPHVHYHIIPAPKAGELSSDIVEKVDHVTGTLSEKEMLKKEFEYRHEMNDDEGQQLAERIRARL